jgi:hypothetical protein
MMLIAPVIRLIRSESSAEKPTASQRPVIEDDVDADQLLQGRQRHADPDDREHLPRYGVTQVAHRSLVLARHRLADLVDLRLRLAGVDPPEDGQGLLLVPVGDEMARRFRDDQGGDDEPERGHGLGEEHAAPRVEPEPERLVDAAGGLGDDVVDEERDEDADDDAHLLERGQPPAHRGRRDLGDVGRGDDAGDPDGDAAEEPGYREDDFGRCQGGRNGRDGEQEARPEQRPTTADAIGQPAGDQGTDRRTEKNRRNGEAGRGA